MVEACRPAWGKICMDARRFVERQKGKSCTQNESCGGMVALSFVESGILYGL